MKKDNVSSVYIHIPFCKSICNYCDFCKVFYQKNLVDKYLDCLEEEIKSVYQKEVIRTLYIGGGTPSSLSLSQLKRLFEIIEIFHLSKTCEITMEANFDSLDEEKIIFLKDKINRISLGIETIDVHLQEMIGRHVSKDHIRKIISLLKQYGILNINVDLMYALPKETLKQLETDIAFLLSLDVCHISTYSLILEDHTIFDLKSYLSVDEELDAKMYEMIETRLTSSGYHHYEISNYAKDGYESKHNLVYWKNEYYYGFGVGASSYLLDKRCSTSRSLTKYLDGNIKQDIEKVSMDDCMEYEIMLGLRLDKGVSKSKFKEKFQKEVMDAYNYQSLVQKGYLEENKGSIFIKKRYFYVSDEITLKFLSMKIST